MITTPCNKNATQEVKNVLDYLNSIEGKRIISGQHTQTKEQAELKAIEKMTGKLPALCGFELLSYSQNIRIETADEECITEVLENRETIQKAWEWAARGGLLTFTWHWFSPLGGFDKSFYTEKTDFDAQKALIQGTEENRALCSDMDEMAELLKGFCVKNIPIIWRPFHESEGTWFWWGAKGPETAKQLYRYMYHYFTDKYKLNNLIWVWNSPLAEGYVGDGYCDIISRDIYSKPHIHGDYREEYDELRRITDMDKGVALAENGVLPDPVKLAGTKTPWLWYMVWSKDFVLTDAFNSEDAWKNIYCSDYTVTLDRLPRLYESDGIF